LPTFRLPTALSRAAAVTAAGHRQTSPPVNPLPPLRFPATPRWADGPPRPLARPRSPPARRIGRTRAAPLGQGPNCFDLNLVRVFRVRLQGLFVKNPI
jgi:hypothetical protein